MASPKLRQDEARVPGPSGASKVPYRITAYFWIIKILTTAMGEALSDFLALRYGAVLAGVVGTLVFAVALVLQFRARRYRVWIYWFAVAMVAVWGTLAADGLHIKLGVPYALSSTFFAVCLAVVFVAWYATERTLSIHSITTPRRELFYWATVLATFALGTALGDFTATTLHLGFLASGVGLCLGLAAAGAMLAGSSLAALLPRTDRMSLHSIQPVAQEALIVSTAGMAIRFGVQILFPQAD